MKQEPTDTNMFALFGGEAYYPGGGWHDFKGVFSSQAEAKKATEGDWDFWHIIDIQTFEVVEYYGSTCYCEGAPLDQSGREGNPSALHDEEEVQIYEQIVEMEDAFLKNFES